MNKSFIEGGIQTEKWILKIGLLSPNYDNHNHIMFVPTTVKEI